MLECRLSLSQIISEYAKEKGITVNPKKLTPAFTNYIIELGITPANLKTANGKYSFSESDANFIRQFFKTILDVKIGK